MRINSRLPRWSATAKYGTAFYIETIEDFKRAYAEKHIIDIDRDHIIGFVYEVQFSNGKRYIGRKQILSENKVDKGKKELAAMEDKRGSKKKKVVRETDWKLYFGSFKDKQLISDLQSGKVTVVHRCVLGVASTKSQLTFLETAFLFSEGVLEPQNKDIFVNDNILGKFFRKAIQPNNAN